MANGASAEIAVVGNEGIVGISMFMGANRFPAAPWCRVLARFPTERTGVETRIQSCGPVLRLLLHYTQAW